MANFTTHVAVGTVASGVMATLVMAANVVEPEAILTLAAAGTLGSVLPDVDLKDSRPSQALFALFGIFISFAVLFNVGMKYSIAEMWILWISTYLLVRYVGHGVFHRFSIHRGVYHSLLAGAFFAFVTAAVYNRLFGAHEAIAWLAGLFMFLGYVVHLVLDEVYSVDIMDVRIKTSFGTALKLFDRRYKLASAAMAVAAIIAYSATPPIGTFLQAITSSEIRMGLQQRLLPQETWFGFVTKNFQLVQDWLPAGMRREPSGITTGSTTPAEAAPRATGASPVRSIDPSRAERAVPAPTPAR